MWLTDLQSAMAELFQIYGMWCCVERISQNVVTMTNGDKWRITGEGHVERIRKNQQGHFCSCFFSAAPTVDGHGIFHYTTSPAICQVKSAKKIHKLFFPNLCNITTCILRAGMVYYHCQEGTQTEA